MSNFLDLNNKYFFITGINNKKSVAYFIAKSIKEHGGKLILSVQNEKQKEFAKKSFSESKVLICDVSKDEDIENLKEQVKGSKISGLVHSMAYANLKDQSFEETSFEDFSQAIKISSYSLMSLSNALKKSFTEGASVVTISISNLRATSYGYMGPIKAMLNSSIDFLAKSFSKQGQVRFNAIAAGPLKTAASAGIPNYMPNYLYAEKLTLRKMNLKTSEVSDAALFLLSNKSSGINASTITVDAGMNANYFDEDIVQSSYSI